MKNRVWNTAALMATIISLVVCGCSGKNGGNKDATKQEEAAKALAEREVRRRESSWGDVESDVLDRTSRPSGLEVVVHVWRLPPAPGNDRYVTVYNNKIVRYDPRK